MDTDTGGISLQNGITSAAEIQPPKTGTGACVCDIANHTSGNANGGGFSKHSEPDCQYNSVTNTSENQQNIDTQNKPHPGGDQTDGDNVDSTTSRTRSRSNSKSSSSSRSRSRSRSRSPSADNSTSRSRPQSPSSSADNAKDQVKDGNSGSLSHPTSDAALISPIPSTSIGGNAQESVLSVDDSSNDDKSTEKVVSCTSDTTAPETTAPTECGSVLKAAMTGDCVSLARLLEGLNPQLHGIQGPAARCQSLSTALLLGVSKGYPGIVRLLLQHVKDTKLYNRWYPLVLTAIDGNNVEIVELLSDHNVSFVATSKFGSALHHAARTGNPELMRLVLDMECCDVNLLNQLSASSPLHVAAQFCHTECARLLLEQGATVDELNNQHQTALHLAVMKGNRELVELLLARGADSTCVFLNGKNITPWMYAIKYRHSDIAAQLLFDEDVHKPYEIQNGKSQLHLACASGSHECARELLARGAFPAQWDNDRCTPLYYAVKNKHLSLVRLLTSQPTCLVNNTSSGGRTVLQALYEVDSNFSVVTQSMYEVLRQAGVDFNQPFSFGCTPLMANIANEKVAKWLLEAKADPNVVVGEGNTAFFEAVERSLSSDDYGPLRTLMNANFSMSLTKLRDPNRDNGTTPLQSTLRYEYPDLAHFLVDIGCSLDGVAEWLQCEDSKDCRNSTHMSLVLRRIEKLLSAGKVSPLQELSRTAVLSTLGHLRVKQKIQQLCLPELLKDFLWWETYAAMNRQAHQLDFDK